MSKHTPGPWLYEIGGDPHNQGLIYSETTGANVAVAYDGEKDTALIAAAPDLLKALSDLVAMCHMPEVKQAMMKHNQAYYHTTMQNAYDALRKAEGE